MDNNLSKKELAYIEYENQFTDKELQRMSDKNNEIPRPLLYIGLASITLSTVMIAYMTVFAPMGWWMN